ncbi:phage major head subunit gpT-like protein [Hephaestia caeni]|uniref:Phage major head subunit gpT-like protein n=1 Tax=Hephaestia caeni TaxID=645617 RepID=A0A397P3B4_9SPHN|nr:Mu-like prophage major head subunit gpT family protein [Hephaestia caeni]RIA44050.1 phage major head subunit gpT-like protein [Hephaestia caeni]
MIINRANLDAVRTGFNTSYSKGLGMAKPQYQRIATTVPATTREQKYGWLGKMPNVRKWVGPRAVQNLQEHDYSIKEEPWEMTIAVNRDDIETDNIGLYAPMFEQMGQSSGSFWDTLCWGMLPLGFSTACYDGQSYFDTDHPVLDADGKETSVANTDGGAGTAWYLVDDSQVLKPVILQKRRDFKFVAKDKDTDDNVFDQNENVYGVDARANVGFGFWQFAWGSKQTLNADNYKKARAGLAGMKGDYGRPLGLSGKTLIVPPSLEGAGLELLNAERDAAGATNVWRGTAELLIVPWLA